MGLDVSHGCWHGAYSAFMRFRMEVAKAAGIPLPLMEGFWGYINPYTRADGGDTSSLDRAMAWAAPKEEAFSASPEGGMMATRDSLLSVLGDIQKRGHEVHVLYSVLEDILTYLPLKWDAWEDDPLTEFLLHSDCDGNIKGVRYQRALADRLEQIKPNLPTEGWGHLADCQEAAQKWIDGLREAASKRQTIRFH